MLPEPQKQVSGAIQTPFVPQSVQIAIKTDKTQCHEFQMKLFNLNTVYNILFCQRSVLSVSNGHEDQS